MLMKIGDVEIQSVLECAEPFIHAGEFFPKLGDAAVQVMIQEAPKQICHESGRVILPIQSFLIKTPQHNILVDTCLGHDKTSPNYAPWHKRNGGTFIAELMETKCHPDEIDYVLCTHLHVDHVGWNTQLIDGRWVPTFRNAKYLFSAADHADLQEKGTDVYQESVLPIVAAGLAEMIGPDYMIGDHVSLISTPGHTAGHVSVVIKSGGREVVISGDALHSPIQVTRPDLCMKFDADLPTARASRRALLAHAAESQCCFVGTHFPLPSIGKIGAKGDVFEWVEDEN